MTQRSHVHIFGIPLTRSDPDEALIAVSEASEREGPTLVFYANAHTLNLTWRDADYAGILKGADLVLNDGIGVQIAARMRGALFPANLNGSDFNPRLLELAADRGWSVYLFGAAEGVAEEAARRLLAQIPGLSIAGTHHGYPSDDEEVVRLIRESGADLLMVAMGNPHQEQWLARHVERSGARVGVGVGAFFDFTAGVQRRAPAWVNRIGLEWAYRLFLEPRRMWRRYVVGNPTFLWRAWRTRRTDRAAAG
jgi:exopolysaccharide biosynthesis WecB/TagA/CpsF family protein